MKLLEKEQVLWQSKNNRLVLTTHRLREEFINVFGSSLKSILLEELTCCELRTTREYSYLRKAALYFFGINGVMYFIKNVLFETELIKIFFGEVSVGSNISLLVFFISVLAAIIYSVLFVTSVRKTYYFYTSGMSIQCPVKNIDHDEREHFITQIEEAKSQRMEYLFGLGKPKL